MLVGGTALTMPSRRVLRPHGKFIHSRIARKGVTRDVALLDVEIERIVRRRADAEKAQAEDLPKQATMALSQIEGSSAEPLELSTQQKQLRS